jgi:hypothetical protein
MPVNAFQFRFSAQRVLVILRQEAPLKITEYKQSKSSEYFETRQNPFTSTAILIMMNTLKPVKDVKSPYFPDGCQG